MTEQEDIQRLYRCVEQLGRDLDNLKAERAREREKWLRTGLIVVGSMFLSVAAWAWSQVDHLVTLNIGGRGE